MTATNNTNIILPQEEETISINRQYPVFSIHQNTPLEWLKGRIDQANAQCPEKLKVVLLITGSMCPVHKMHLNALKIAGDYLEKNYDYHILGGFISPSNDRYILGKLGDKAIPFVDRVAMCRLAVEELDFKYPVVVDGWEGNIPDFYDFNFVRDHLTIAIRDAYPNEKILVLYVDGIDHFDRCRVGEWWYKVATVLRPPYETSAVTNLEKHIYVCTDDSGTDVSSSEIRKRIMAGESIEDLTFHSVSEYLAKYYEKKKILTGRQGNNQITEFLNNNIRLLIYLFFIIVLIFIFTKICRNI